jgi:hypothetical protein
MHQSIEPVPHFMPCIISVVAAAYYLSLVWRPSLHLAQKQTLWLQAVVDLATRPVFACRWACGGWEKDQKASVRRSVVPDDGRCKCYSLQVVDSRSLRLRRSMGDLRTLCSSRGSTRSTLRWSPSTVTGGMFPSDGEIRSGEVRQSWSW